MKLTSLLDSIHWFCKRTAKVLIRLRRCTGWSGLSFSVRYGLKGHFTQRGSFVAYCAFDTRWKDIFLMAFCSKCKNKNTCDWQYLIRNLSSRKVRKHAFWHVRPVKTEISLRIHVFVVRMKQKKKQKTKKTTTTFHSCIYTMRPVNSLIRLHACAGWFESTWAHTLWPICLFCFSALFSNNYCTINFMTNGSDLCTFNSKRNFGKKKKKKKEILLFFSDFKLMMFHFNNVNASEFNSFMPSVVLFSTATLWTGPFLAEGMSLKFFFGFLKFLYLIQPMSSWQFASTSSEWQRHVKNRVE